MLEIYLMMNVFEILLIHKKKALSSMNNGNVSVIDKGKGYFLGKWTHKRVGKASDETINKKYTE